MAERFFVARGRTLGWGVGAVGPGRSVPIGQTMVSAPQTGNALQLDRESAIRLQRGGFGRIVLTPDAAATAGGES